MKVRSQLLHDSDKKQYKLFFLLGIQKKITSICCWEKIQERNNPPRKTNLTQT